MPDLAIHPTLGSRSVPFASSDRFVPDDPTIQRSRDTPGHGCVGQHIARVEIEPVLLALDARVRTIEPDGNAVWPPNNAMRALDRLPLRPVPA